MPGGADDLSYLIKKVTFKLHETYPNPNRGEHSFTLPHYYHPTSTSHSGCRSTH